MSAVIQGFVTRQEAGLAKPKSVSTRITPEKGGFAIHHGGGPQAAARSDADHEQCVDTWRRWQKFHMSKGWVDIAYTGGVCQHGYAFAGRGAGVRTAAQGTNEGNQNFHAVVWIGGEGQIPTEDALNALDWWLVTLREAGNAGLDVRPHKFFKPTGCPIQELVNWAYFRNGKRDFVTTAPVAKPKPKPKPAPVAPVSASPTPVWVKRMQNALGVKADGMWGPDTDEHALRMRNAARSRSGWPVNIHRAFNVKQVQDIIGTKVDGIWGPRSQAALVRWIKVFQNVLNVQADGKWGPKTDGKFLSVRRRNLNRY